ncbi:MAG: C40 family peptidase [Pseudonocardiaceae bacterium]
MSRTVDYVVATGDTLVQIAAAHSMPGGWQQIYDANRGSISDPNLVLVGQHLTLPDAGAAVVSAAAPPAIAAITPRRAAAATSTPGKTTLPSAASSAPIATRTVDLRLAMRVVAAAVAQQGTPYVWGGNAPGGFDCSGLVQWSYKKVGVALPRTAAAQATVGRRVSVNQLQPGDLLFFYQPVGHVVMYVGNGNIVEASQPGKPIQVRPMYLSGFVTARRVL